VLIIMIGLRFATPYACAQLANRIRLHLALGDSFNPTPAATLR